MNKNGHTIEHLRRTFFFWPIMGLNEGEVYLAPLWALRPGFKASHLQVNTSTATLTVKGQTGNKMVKSHRVTLHHA